MATSRGPTDPMPADGPASAANRAASGSPRSQFVTGASDSAQPVVLLDLDFGEMVEQIADRHRGQLRRG